MKKILLDTSTLLSPQSAIGLYTKKIANELLLNNSFKPFFLFDSQISDKLIFEKKKKIIDRIISKNLILKYNYISLYIKKFVKYNKVDIFHQPNFISYNTGIKNINNIHDFSWIHYPDYFHKEEIKWFENFFEKSLKQSFKVIVHSKFIKNELIKLFNYPEENIFIIHQDLQGDFSVLEENNCKDFLYKYNLEYKKFFLCINTLELRKNYKTLIKSYQSLDEKIKKNYPLIIFGMKGRFSNQILDLIDKTDNCYYYGYIDEKLRNQCYSSAKLFFYPSLYEGFGIPPLQSMACGTPVIASNIDSAKEILQDSCVLVDSLNVDLWSKYISELLRDFEKYNFYVNLGIKRAKLFNNGDTPKKVLSCYQNLNFD